MTQPTLIELLDIAATGMISEANATALRAASQRLREEMRVEAVTDPNSDMGRYVNRLLTRINNGPIPTPTAPTCAECKGEGFIVRYTAVGGHGKGLREVCPVCHGNPVPR